MAVSNSLGTLTLDIIANVGGFTGPLDQAARITKKQMKEMGMAVDEFGNYTDRAMKQAAQATKQLDEQFKKMAQNVDRELALYGETSRVAKARYDLENTELAKLDAVKKAAYLEDMRRLDAMESASAAFRQQAAEMERVNGLYLQHEQAMKREIALYGESSREAKIRYEIERGALASLSKDKQFKLLLDARALDAMDAEAAKAKELAAATKQLDAQHEQLNESMLAQLATYGQVTRVAKLRYDMERGALKGLTEAQKQSSLQLAEQLDNLDKAAMGSMRGIRGVATGIGYQMQDIAVQLQMGTNPLMVFAQQGSQIASLFGPTGAIAGAVIAIGGALAGALIPNLFKTGEAAEDVADKVAALVSEMDKLDMAQRRVVETANQYRISDKQAEYDELTKSIEKQRQEVERLTAAQGSSQNQSAAVAVGTLGLSAGATSVGVNLVESLAKATRDLNKAEVELVAIEQELADLNDPQKAKELINSKLKELELIGLKGDALYKQMAIQAQLTGLDAYAFEQVMRNIEAAKALAKAEEDAAKAREDAAKKAADDERSRAEGIARTIAGMEREIALYGVTSKAAQMEYDILNGVLKVKGGLEGVEGKRLLQAAKMQDALESQRQAQDDYLAKLNDWVKGENNKDAAIKKILQSLKDEEAQLYMTADAYLEMQLRAQGATNAEVAEALQRSQRIRDMKDQIKAEKDAAEELTRRVEEMWNRVDAAAADAWSNMLDGTQSSLEGIADLFKKMLAEMAHEAVTKPILINFRNQFANAGMGDGGSISGYTGQAYQNWLSGKGSSSSSSSATSFMGGTAGLYAAGAAVAIAAVSSWNKSQDEKFEKMTAAYRQGVQSTGTLLGMANAKSDSISQALSEMGDLSGDMLNVNRDMYMALLAIESGINGVAAGFARQFEVSGGAGDWSNIRTGSVAGVTRLGETSFFKEIERGAAKLDIIGGEFITAFAGGLMDGINKAVFNKSKRIIDSGIQFIGQSLADILEEGTVGAFAYADIRTKKRVLGVTVSNKVNTETEDLNDILLGQFADVFEGAGSALEQAAEAFGLDFDNYINRLVVDPQKLSLKDLEGDALTKEIEAFFSATLDGWAATVVEGLNKATSGSDAKKWADALTGGGEGVLERFQQVGEGAFETVIRLANQLNTFNSYADRLNLNFAAVGFAAIEASQNIAEFAGGFDQLSSSLSGYYQNFFTEEERASKQMELLSAELSELGINSVPVSREAFRSIIEALVTETGLLTEESQKQFAALVNLQGIFAELVPATEALVEVSRTAKEIADERLQLETQALQLLGDTEELRRRELAALDPSNRALQNFIWKIQDATAAAEEAAKANETLIESLKSAAGAAMEMVSRSIAAERARIEGIVGRASAAKTVLDEAISREKEALSESYNLRKEAIEAEAEAERQAAKVAADARKEAIKSQISIAEDAIKNLSSIFESLTDAVKEMAFESDELTRERRRAAEFEIDTAIRNARAGRGLPQAQVIQEALGALQNNPTSLYSSFAEMSYATAVTQNKLLELANLTQGQLSAEQIRLAQMEVQAKAAEATIELASKYDEQLRDEAARYESQVAALDAAQETARKQLDALTGVDTSIVSLEDAFTRFNESILAADFQNAKAQLEALDVIETTAQAQLNALLGVDARLLSVNESLLEFGEAVRIANERIPDIQAQSPVETTLAELLEQFTALREESYNLNQETRKNTQDTADILRQMQEEAMTP